MNEFCKEEVELYDEIIDLLEYTVDDETNIIEYNGLPVKIKNKILIRMCEESNGYDEDKYITFKPLKNHKHCQLIIDFLHENESDRYELTIRRIKDKENKSKFIGKIYDTQSDIIIAETSKCFSEIEAKFKVLYIYFFDEEKINKRINIIRKYDNSYIREIKNQQKQNKKGKKKKK